MILGAKETVINLDLIAGWNMFAGPGCSTDVSSINDPSGIKIPGSIFGFDKGYVVADTLRQGQGYWMMTNAAGLITLDCSALLLK